MAPLFLSELPLEILEYILLSLPPAGILRMKEVNHHFLDLVLSSQHLQHRLDLFNAGLIDNHRVGSGLAGRRARLREYVDRWEDPRTSTQYECSLKNGVNAFTSTPAGQDLFLASSVNDQAQTISFTRIPSSPTQEMAEEWVVEFPLPFGSWAVSPQDDLLASIKTVPGSISVQILSLLDGSPHQAPLHRDLSWHSAHYSGGPVISSISRSRIVLLIELRNGKQLVAWDWRTGETVLKHSYDDPEIGRAISFATTVHLLGGSLLLAMSRDVTGPQLLVFNTLILQQDPRSFRILQLPQLPNSRNYSILTECENSLGEYPEFSVDPTQSNFVLFCPLVTALVVSVELLTRCMGSAHTSPRVLWGDWGEGVVTMDLRIGVFDLQLVETKVLTLHSSPPLPGGFTVEMYDLSRSGQKDVRAQRVSEGEVGRTTRRILTPKWSHLFQLGDIASNNIFLVGNKVACFHSRPQYDVTGDHYLRIWKFG